MLYDLPPPTILSLVPHLSVPVASIAWNAPTYKSVGNMECIFSNDTYTQGTELGQAGSGSIYSDLDRNVWGSQSALPRCNWLQQILP